MVIQKNQVYSTLVVEFNDQFKLTQLNFNVKLTGQLQILAF